MTWSLADELLAFHNTLQNTSESHANRYLLRGEGETSRQLKTKNVAVTGMQVTDRLTKITRRQ